MWGLFLCVLVVAFAETDFSAYDYRLLAIDDVEPPFWAPIKVVENLALSGVHFLDLTDHQVLPPQPSRFDIPEGPQHQGVVNPLLSLLNRDNLERDLNSLSSFQNRYYTSSYGVASAQWIFDTASTAAKMSTSNISVTFYDHSWAQPSVIARIEGSNPGGPLTIVGAHEDSTAPGMPTGRAPGAEDDGSGCVVLLEVLRQLAAGGFVPVNPIEFQFYAAEEVGLRGSADIANDYAARSVAVRAMINFDMTGFEGNSNNAITIITDFTDSETNTFLRTLADEYLTVRWSNGICGYACSDHASYHRVGYRSSHPWSGGNPFIHTSNDTINRIDFNRVLQFARLCLAFAVELSL
eukprot:Lithocolla_globosa_v1_NODE_3633_length_1620_cov_5.578275.p1 type:complete len:351 gc:universal NODE_3633_length_1620_cov_5.578275:1159-107(-)